MFAPSGRSAGGFRMANVKITGLIDAIQRQQEARIEARIRETTEHFAGEIARLRDRVRKLEEAGVALGTSD